MELARIHSSRREAVHVRPMPPQVAAAVRADSSRLLFPESGGYRSVEKWRPRELDVDTARLVSDYLADLEAALEPADRGTLLARVLALLSHYRLEAHSPAVEQAIADDWAEDLGCFPMWAVENAAREWRKTRKFKPTICEMIAACEKGTEHMKVVRERLRRLLDERPADAEEADWKRRVRNLTAGTFAR